MSVKERLKRFISYKKLTAQQFEIEVGLANGYISNMRKGVGGVALERISNRFPELSQPWLLTGEGEMLKAETTNTGHPIIPSARDADDRFDRLMKIVEMQSKQMEVQSKQIEMLLNKIDRLEKQGSGEGPRPNEASDHT